MLSLILLLALAAPDAPATPSPPQPEASAPATDVKPADISNAVDENGVPAWAKRKRKQFVQNCPAERPNIGVETWRSQYDKSGRQRLKPKTATVTCK